MTDALKAEKEFKTDRRRGAYLHEIKLFYEEIGIKYINEFLSKPDLMTYRENVTKFGDKKKFALGFSYTDKMKKSIETATGTRVATLIFHECGIKNILWSPL
jgi:hypothetical protein